MSNQRLGEVRLHTSKPRRLHRTTMSRSTAAPKPQKLAKAFRKWGNYLGTEHRRVLIGTSILALCLAVLAAATFRMDTSDGGEMFNPKGNLASAERQRLHDTFGNLDVAPTSVIFSRVDNGNMVTREAFNMTLHLHRRLMEFTIPNADPSTQQAKPNVTFADLCLALPNGDCLTNSVLRCFGFNEPPSTMVVTDPACLDVNNVPVFTRTSIGGDLRLTPMPGIPSLRLIGAAKAVRYDYIALATTEGQKSNNHAWERQAASVMAQFATEVLDTYKVSFANGTGVVWCVAVYHQRL